MSSGLLKLLTPAGSPPRPSSPSSRDAAQHQPKSLTRAGSLRPPFASPPCCSSCGAAKAEGCSGCGGAFCRACMGLQLSSKAAGGCSNCDKLCSSCKPVACSFCEELREDQEAPVRMCEACAGGCDACQRAACGACRAAFSSCNSCGFAACEDCWLQMQLQPGSNSSSLKAGAGLLTSSGSLGCWCAPPLRMASNVSHVSSQRYQMAQLHPSLLSGTMEATGLRDADYDEDETFEYEYEEDDDVLLGGHADDDGPRRGSTGAAAPASGGGGSTSRHQGSLALPAGEGRHQPGSGCATTLSQQRVEALIGSRPSMTGVHVLPAAVPLSPSSSSSHSSSAHHQFYGGSGGSLNGSAPHAVSQLLGLPGLARHHHQYHHY